MLLAYIIRIQNVLKSYLFDLKIFLSMILFIKYHNHKCRNSIQLIIHYIHLYKRVLSLTMSVPDHSKKTNHQVIQMGYNTNLIKILILLNIILIIVFSICVFRMSKGRSHQKIDYLNEKIYELQMKINKLTSKNNQNIDESTILQHITLVNDHLEMSQNQGNLVQKQIKLIKAMINELKESDENQWKKIRNQESKLGQVNQVINKILQNLKPVQRYIESFQAPNMQNFKAKFTETFADLKAKFRRAFNQQNQQKDSSKNDL